MATKEQIDNKWDSFMGSVTERMELPKILEALIFGIMTTPLSVQDKILDKAIQHINKNK